MKKCNENNTQINYQLKEKGQLFFCYFSTLNKYLTDALGNLYTLITLFTPPATCLNASSASKPYFFLIIYPPALKEPFLTSSPASTIPSYKLINTLIPVTAPSFKSVITFCSEIPFTPSF